MTKSKHQTNFKSTLMKGILLITAIIFISSAFTFTNIEDDQTGKTVNDEETTILLYSYEISHGIFVEAILASHQLRTSGWRLGLTPHLELLLWCHQGDP